jgi:hypothetical protein
VLQGVGHFRHTGLRSRRQNLADSNIQRRRRTLPEGDIKMGVTCGWVDSVVDSKLSKVQVLIPIILPASNKVAQILLKGAVSTAWC